MHMQARKTTQQRKVNDLHSKSHIQAICGRATFYSDWTIGWQLDGRTAATSMPEVTAETYV